MGRLEPSASVRGVEHGYTLRPLDSVNLVEMMVAEAPVSGVVMKVKDWPWHVMANSIWGVALALTEEMDTFLPNSIMLGTRTWLMLMEFS